MYYIITDDKEIINFAKRKGANIIGSNEKNVTFVNTLTRAYEFISSFPNVDMESVGARALVYILDNITELRGDIRETVYPYVAKAFGTTVNALTSAISCTSRRCISRYPNKECMEYFLQYECGTRWSTKNSLEFVKVCKEYLMKEQGRTIKKVRGIDGKVIETFFSSFNYANKKTLGYQCVKYILESGIECIGKDEETIYRALAYKFNTKVKVIKQSITYFLNNCRYNARFGMPREFKIFYENHIKYENKSIEQMNFAFISICEMYLKKNSKK